MGNANDLNPPPANVIFVCISLLVLFPFSFGHWVVCPFIYEFWLPPFGIFNLFLLHVKNDNIKLSYYWINKKPLYLVLSILKYIYLISLITMVTDRHILIEKRSMILMQFYLFIEKNRMYINMQKQMRCCTRIN